MATRKSDDPNPTREAAVKFLRERQQRIEDNTIGFRWYVTEDRPAGENEYGGYVPPKSHIVSGYFDSREDAEAWRDEHDPAPGWTLRIGRDRLVIIETWMRG